MLVGSDRPTDQGTDRQTMSVIELSWTAKKFAPPERRRTEKEKTKNVLGKSRKNVLEKKNTSFAEVGKRSEGKRGNIIS